ncbi:OmpW family outer membrane protein [Spirosoma soli]|uniref:OmpW family outer membrane protein n=1 Tax=Spirosoma soli TaxID=1770529 RepID=A0ABW5M6L6_9BACT
MINTIKVTASLLVVMVALLLPGGAKAQFQVNVTGNYLGPAESGSSFSDGPWGGGVTLRYFVSPNLAVGLNGRYFSSNGSANFDFGSGAGIGASGSVKASANLLAVTGQAEYFFSESALRPYVGIEAGLYRAAGTVEISDGFNTIKASESANNFGVAPKVGLQYAISPAFGVNADAGYHIVFSDGDTSKFLLLGAGVYFTFGQR